MKFLFDASIPDLSDHLARLLDPEAVQEKIHRLIAAYRAWDAMLECCGTPKEAEDELDKFIKAVQPALDAMGGPALALLDVPGEVSDATRRTLARLLDAAEAARERIQEFIPKRGGQGAPKHRDIAIRRIVDMLHIAGAKNRFVLTARILEQCGVSAPTTGQGIRDIYHQMQAQIPGRRVIRA